MQSISRSSSLEVICIEDEDDSEKEESSNEGSVMEKDVKIENDEHDETGSVPTECEYIKNISQNLFENTLDKI